MRGWLLLFMIGVLLTMGIVALAERTEIGPVLIELTPQHGIHAGDLLFTLLAIAVFACIGRRVRRHQVPL